MTTALTEYHAPLRRRRRRSREATGIAAFWIMTSATLAAPILMGAHGAFAVYPVGVGVAAALLMQGPSRLALAQSVKPLAYLALIAFCFIVFCLAQTVPLPQFLAAVLPRNPFYRDLPQVSIIPGASVQAIGHLLIYAGFAVALFQALSDRRAQRFFGRLLFVMGAASAAGVLISQNFTADQLSLEAPVTGLFVSKNAFAAYLGMMLILGLGLWKSHVAAHRKLETHLVRIGYGVALALIAAALIATQSRLGLVSTAIAAGMFLPFNRTLVRMAILAFAALVALILATGPELLDRFQDVPEDLAERLLLWNQVFGIAVANPLTGTGLGTFELAFEHVHAAPLTSEVSWNHAHSGYLQVLAETGWIAGLLPLLFAGTWMVFFITCWSHAKGDQIHTCTGAAILIQIALHSVADIPLIAPANILTFIAILTLITTQFADEAHAD